MRGPSDGSQSWWGQAQRVRESIIRGQGSCRGTYTVLNLDSFPLLGGQCVDSCASFIIIIVHHHQNRQPKSTRMSRKRNSHFHPKRDILLFPLKRERQSMRRTKRLTAPESNYTVQSVEAKGREYHGWSSCSDVSSNHGCPSEGGRAIYAGSHTSDCSDIILKICALGRRVDVSTKRLRIQVNDTAE